MNRFDTKIPSIEQIEAIERDARRARNEAIVAGFKSFAGLFRARRGKRG